MIPAGGRTMTDDPDATPAVPDEDDDLDPEVLRLERLYGPPDDGFATDEEWEAELARRIEDVRSGREKGIPAAEAHKLIFGDDDGHPG
jgi:hypothetical protein